MNILCWKRSHRTEKAVTKPDSHVSSHNACEADAEAVWSSEAKFVWVESKIASREPIKLLVASSTKLGPVLKGDVFNMVDDSPNPITSTVLLEERKTAVSIADESEDVAESMMLPVGWISPEVRISDADIMTSDTVFCSVDVDVSTSGCKADDDTDDGVTNDIPVCRSNCNGVKDVAIPDENITEEGNTSDDGSTTAEDTVSNVAESFTTVVILVWIVSNKLDWKVGGLAESETYITFETESSNNDFEIVLVWSSARSDAAVDADPEISVELVECKSTDSIIDDFSTAVSWRVPEIVAVMSEDSLGDTDGEKTSDDVSCKERSPLDVPTIDMDSAMLLDTREELSSSNVEAIPESKTAEVSSDVVTLADMVWV